jgi:hypothetical protein
MDDIYYLIHNTNDPNCVNWKELKTAIFNTDDQFPGAYLSIITKNNIDTEFIFPGKYVMIFSKKILLQKNYHMNLIDYNGIISENNTYFSWNLENFLEKIKQRNIEKSNEIIFHDNIDMKYCCLIIHVIKKNEGIIIRKNDILPRRTIENEEQPDMSKIPFLCYPFEDIYTGINPLPRSSKEWFYLMANVCNIKLDKDDNEDNIIGKIKEKSKELYNHRELQNIKLLEDNVIKKGGNVPVKIFSYNKKRKITRNQRQKITQKITTRK